MFKKIAVSVTSIALALSVFISAPETTHAGGFYPVQKTTTGLDLRAYSPTINGARSETNIPNGWNLWLYCYVNGESYYGSKVWDYVDDNKYGGDWNEGYAPDYFIKTGSSSPVVPYCNW